MSILSDLQIRQLCQPPSHRLDEAAYYAQLNKEGPLPPYDILPELDTPPKFNDWCVEHKSRIWRENLIETTDEERDAFVPMISPFNQHQIREVFGSITKPMGSPPSMVTIPTNSRKIISLGLTSYGYDVSLAEEFKIFTNINSTIIDPKRMSEGCLVDAKVQTDEDGSRYVIIPPNSYMLGRTNEYFRMPRDVLALCVGKSTYARVGGIVNVTPIEPGFEGHVVIEISNSAPLPLKVYANEGISQFLFLQGTQPCQVSYGDRDGKYQGQTGIQLAKV